MNRCMPWPLAVLCVLDNLHGPHQDRFDAQYPEMAPWKAFTAGVRGRRVRPARDLMEPLEIITVTEQEGHALFDKAARSLLGISGEEFLRRLDAGEYPDCGCCPHEVFELRMLEPFARKMSG